MRRALLLVSLVLAGAGLVACDEPETMTIAPTIRTDGDLCQDYIGRAFEVRVGGEVFDEGVVNAFSHDPGAVCVASFSALAPTRGSFVVEVEGLEPVTSSRETLQQDAGQLSILDISSERLDALAD